MTAVLIDVDFDGHVHLGLGEGLGATEETDTEKERETEGRAESRKEADREGIEGLVMPARDVLCKGLARKPLLALFLFLLMTMAATALTDPPGDVRCDRITSSGFLRFRVWGLGIHLGTSGAIE